MRSVLAVLAGFASWTVLWLTSNQILVRVFADRFAEDMTTRDPMVLGLVFLLSVVFSVIAGWVTASVARKNGVPHGIALGVIQTAVGIFVQMQVWDQMPLWYHLAFLICLLPGNVLGAWLKSR